MRLTSGPFLRRLVDLSCAAGINPYQLLCTVKRMPRFRRELRAYRAQADPDFPLSDGALMPVLVDYETPAGVTGHYFHQDLWAARLIAARRPAQHFDIGSRVDGFVAHLLTVMPVTLIDIRPLHDEVAGLTFQQGSVVSLGGFADGSIDSLSTLHAIEHVGLGRYGDPVDARGWRKAIAELTRVLKAGGRLYFSVPIGRQRVLFNAHRIFYVRTVLDAFASLRLVSFAAVDDSGAFIPRASVTGFDTANEACGLFEFTKDA